jgi:NAD(P)-dependent dehydrogenase (short-subunit alcohol dehydrogenase family)
VNGRTRARVVQAVEQLKHELSRHYLPAMRERDWGRIVFVSSESAVQIPVEMIHYGMTKIAQIAIARGLAESLAGAALRVDGGVVRAIV